MAEPNASRIAWIDTETTGLNAHDLLLEIAVIITDNELNELGSMSEVIWHPQQSLDVLLTPYVENMHRSSGLYDEVLASMTTIPAAEHLVGLLLETTDAVGSVVAGSSVSFDRNVMNSWMPNLNNNLLHCRNIDVSSLKEVMRRFVPGRLESSPVKSLDHRALDDIRESIAEFQHYLPALTGEKP